MRRFSQRNNLVTLSDINITPLLDLAFVLLIIFVITTPLLEQGLDLKLPAGGRADGNLVKENIRQVEISADGRIFLAGKPKTLGQLESEVVKEFGHNPNLTVFIRADEAGRVGTTVSLIDMCQRHGIPMSIRTREPNKK